MSMLVIASKAEMSHASQGVCCGADKNRNATITKSLLLNGKDVTYHLIPSRRARTVRINISHEQGLRVIVPMRRVRGNRANAIDIPGLLLRKSDWILKHLERIEKSEKPRLANGGTLLYQGEPHKTFIKHDLFPTVVRCNCVIHLYVRQASEAADLLQSWFIQQAKKEIVRRLEEINLQIGLPYRKVIIRNQKSLWGSCAPNKTLSFNWRLMMVPPKVMDYVLIHELIHLQVPNHSLGFWKRVVQYDPDYLSHRHWLKVQGPLLYWDRNNVGTSPAVGYPDIVHSTPPAGPPMDPAAPHGVQEEPR